MKTKLEQERENKKTVGETSDLLDALGQDSESKGAKVAKELAREEHDAKEKRDITTVEKLESARSKKYDPVYYQSILAECILRMQDYQLPIGFRWKASVSTEGLAMHLGTPIGTYAGGVKITGVPYNDAKGVIGLVNQALIDVELLEQEWKIQSSIKTKN